VIAGRETDGRWLGGAGRQLRAQMLSPFVGKKLGTFIAAVNAQDLFVLKDLIEAGKGHAGHRQGTYALREAPDAIRYFEAGHARGKVAITV
jgi:hypothetical protein